MRGIKTGRATGTGVAMNIDIGFTPKVFEYKVSESSCIGFWEDSMRDATGIIEHCAELRTGEIIIGAHLPSAGTTDTQIANTRVVSQHDGAGDVRVEVAAVAAGTAFAGAADDITAALWGSYRVAVATGGAISITPGLASGPMVYTTEALAIAGLGALPANEADMGYVTVHASAGAIFDATTDGLSPTTATGTAPAAVNFYEGYGIMFNGITPIGDAQGDLVHGVTIGTHALLNVLGGIIHWKAYRS